MKSLKMREIPIFGKTTWEGPPLLPTWFSRYDIIQHPTFQRQTLSLTMHFQIERVNSKNLLESARTAKVSVEALISSRQRRRTEILAQLRLTLEAHNEKYTSFDNLLQDSVSDLKNHKFKNP